MSFLDSNTYSNYPNGTSVYPTSYGYEYRWRDYATTGNLPSVTVTTKTFKLGFIIGRFQHIHIGHESIINTALNICEKVILLVGSGQEFGTERNPYTLDKRLYLIRKIYGNNANLIIAGIDDLTHENDHSHDWGRYVLTRVVQIAHDNGIGINPDVMIYGNDEERSTWYHPDDMNNISQLIAPRGSIEISATKMRKYILEGNFFKWRQFTNPKIHDEFSYLLQELINIQYKKGES